MTKLIFIDDMKEINEWQKKVFETIIKNIEESEGSSVITLDAKELLKNNTTEGKVDWTKLIDEVRKKARQQDDDNLVFVIDYRWKNSPGSKDASGLACAEGLAEQYKDKDNVKIILVSSKIHEVEIKDKNIIWCKRPFFEIKKNVIKENVKPDNGLTTDTSSVVKSVGIQAWASVSDKTKKEIYAMCTSFYIKYQFIGCVMACFILLKKRMKKNNEQQPAK